MGEHCCHRNTFWRKKKCPLVISDRRKPFNGSNNFSFSLMQTTSCLALVYLCDVGLPGFPVGGIGWPDVMDPPDEVLLQDHGGFFLLLIRLFTPRKNRTLLFCRRWCRCARKTSCSQIVDEKKEKLPRKNEINVTISRTLTNNPSRAVWSTWAVDHFQAST